MRNFVGLIILMVSGVVWCADEPRVVDGADKIEEKANSEKTENEMEKVLKEDTTLRNAVKRVVAKMEKEDEKLIEAEKRHKEAIAELKEDLIKTYESAMANYTKKGDLRAANALLSQINKMRGDEETVEVEETEAKLSIKVQIDTLTEITITKNEIVMKSMGKTKPGMHNGEFPTYINDTEWNPKWVGSIAKHSLKRKIKIKELKCGVLPLNNVAINNNDDKIVITIPDQEPGSRWYTISLQ